MLTHKRKLPHEKQTNLTKDTFGFPMSMPKQEEKRRKKKRKKKVVGQSQNLVTRLTSCCIHSHPAIPKFTFIHVLPTLTPTTTTTTATKPLTSGDGDALSGTDGSATVSCDESAPPLLTVGGRDGRASGRVG